MVESKKVARAELINELVVKNEELRIEYNHKVDTNFKIIGEENWIKMQEAGDEEAS